MKPQPTFCVCVQPWLHSDIHIRALFLRPTEYQEFKPGGHLELQQRKRAPLPWHQIMWHNGAVLRPSCSGTARVLTQLLI